jgi:hypothetical protein
MKFLITENKLEKVIFTYLDNQDFIQIKRGGNIYFVNSKGDEYAQIRYAESDGWCFIYEGLIEEICSFFSLEESDKVIGGWVENTLKMPVNDTEITPDDFIDELK